jgi:hypothetical protein
LGRRILISLVRSYGVKAQKTGRDIAAEIGERQDIVESALNELIQLRMVRSLEGQYEVVHDFLARRISEELVEEQEREAKRFRELLASKFAAYERTRGLLTETEHLYLYLHRRRFVVNEDEARYLFLSHLAGNGPVEFWMKDYPRVIIEDWTRQASSSDDERIKRNALRYAICLGQRPSLELLEELFGDYKHRTEFARYIHIVSEPKDLPFLLRLKRKRAEEVRQAAHSAILRLLASEHLHEIELIINSKSRNAEQLVLDIGTKLANREKVRDYKRWEDGKSRIEKLLRIIGLSVYGGEKDLEQLLRLARSSSEPKRMRSLLYSCCTRIAIRESKSLLLKGLLQSADTWIRESVYRGIDREVNGGVLELLLASWKDNGDVLGSTVIRAVGRDTYKTVYPFLKKTYGLSGTRELIRAICRFGTGKDFERLLNELQKVDESVIMPNPYVVATEMARIATEKQLPRLRTLLKAKECLTYYGRERTPGETLPVADHENVYFLRYILAFAFGKLARKRDLPLLTDLLESIYWSVWFPAAEAIGRLGNEEDMDMILKKALTRKEDDRIGFVQALVAIDRAVYRRGSTMSGWEIYYESRSGW